MVTSGHGLLHMTMSGSLVLLQMESVLKPMAHVATESCECPGSVQLPESMFVAKGHAAAGAMQI